MRVSRGMENLSVPGARALTDAEQTLCVFRLRALSHDATRSRRVLKTQSPHSSIAALSISAIF